MRFCMLRVASFALGLLFVGSALAQDVSPGSRARPLSRGRTAFTGGAGGVGSIIHPMGVVFSQNGAVAGATGTGEQVIATYSLPAGALDVPGRRVRSTAVFLHAANGNACTFKSYFGSEVISSGSNSTTGSGAVFTTDAVKTGASTQEVTQWGYNVTTNIAIVSTAATEADTAPIVIKASVQGGTTGADCTVSDFVIEFLN